MSAWRSASTELAHTTFGRSSGSLSVRRSAPTSSRRRCRPPLALLLAVARSAITGGAACASPDRRRATLSGRWRQLDETGDSVHKAHLLDSTADAAESERRP